MADNARGIHVSPGVYSREIDMTYAVKSLGITTLGVVGETLRGPAFQPTHIENWREFTATFGGTSTEKFKGSKYPKYELPYIAKSYLTESKQMEVVRVLGLSGYNAGPAWLITAKLKSGEDMVVAVLRSRGTYYKYRKFSETTGSCECPNDIYDSLVYEVGETKINADYCNQPVAYNRFVLGLGEYTPLYSTGNDCIGYHFGGEDEGFEINSINMGRFKISGFTGVHEWYSTKEQVDLTSESPDYFEYAVSLNADDSDYILNVLGTNPNDGDTPIYVESLYDIALGQCIMNTDDTHAKLINDYLTFYQVYYPADYNNLQPVHGIIRIPENNLSSKNLGQRFLADAEAAISDGTKNDPVITCHPYDYQTGLPVGVTLEDVSYLGNYRTLEKIKNVEAVDNTYNSPISSSIEYVPHFFAYVKGDGGLNPGDAPYEEGTRYHIVNQKESTLNFKILRGVGNSGGTEEITTAVTIVSGCAFSIKENSNPKSLYTLLGGNITKTSGDSTSAVCSAFKEATNTSVYSGDTQIDAFPEKYFYSGVYCKGGTANTYTQGNEETDPANYIIQNHNVEWKYNQNKNKFTLGKLYATNGKVTNIPYTYTYTTTEGTVSTPHTATTYSAITNMSADSMVNTETYKYFIKNIGYGFEANVNGYPTANYFTAGTASLISGTTTASYEGNKMIITGISYANASCLYDEGCVSSNTVTNKRDIQNIIENNKNVLTSRYEADVIEPVKPGQIYTVAQYTDTSGKRNYYYRYYVECSLPCNGALSCETADNVVLLDKLYSGYSHVEDTAQTSSDFEHRPNNDAENRAIIVKNYGDGLYYRLIQNTDEGTKAYVPYDVTYVCCDLNDYKSAYRYASTPWVVSNLKGDFNKIELNKLFRFHTISDGDSSNNEIKISIEDIKPDDGCFDVVVRKINDTDQSPVILEKFSRCTLQPGSAKYLGLQIGTYDGMYESQSRYITVEINENSMVEASVPAGFLGYPQVKFDGMPVVDSAKSNIIGPIIKYNLDYDPNIKNRKQYFGLSNLTGVDIDLFTFKGNAAYIEDPDMLTNGFHLDSRLNKSGYPNEQLPTITVDGVEGYKFDAVSQNARTSILTDTPVIGTEAMMQGTIYENVKLRKFTMYFYGGFDGWDVYRQQRSNTDDFKLAKYNGSYNKESGEGYAFNRIEDPELLGLNQNGITSDWYAYLSAYRQFANPESVDVNVFATPGIDYVNNKLLAEEVISMLEEERADSIYVVTTPDKPNGAEDYVSEIFTPQDAVDNLEDTEIDSNYTCTYYPWVKYYDVDNNQYIYLPPTKDVVRNFAQTDNTAYPWFAPAGLDRGNVNCVKARFVTRLSDEDTLYEGRINPIKTFAGDNGVKVWGQKNMQIEDTQLNRIAVRRLLLRMRKLIAIACRSLIFEQNDNVVRNQFLSIVTPIMDNIRSNRGISDYKIEVAESIDEKDCKELNAKIFFKPYCALEYISLDFILTPQGVDFENI